MRNTAFFTNSVALCLEYQINLLVRLRRFSAHLRIHCVLPYAPNTSSRLIGVPTAWARVCSDSRARESVALREAEGKKICPACSNPSRRKGPKKAPPLSTEYCTDRLDSLKPAGIDSDAHIDASPGAHCTRSLKPCVVCYSVLFVLHIGLPAPNRRC